jgi:hypothetical protein
VSHGSLLLLQEEEQNNQESEMSGQEPSQEPSTIELFTADQAGQGRSQRGRVYFKRGDTFFPVKGTYILGDLVNEGADEKIFARLFTYAVEGPPYTPREEDPTCSRLPPAGRTFEVTSINAIHALDDVKVLSAFKGLAEFKIIWGLVPDGAPEHEFAQDLVGAYAAYDELLAGAEDYADWWAKHQAWLGKPQSYDAAEIAADGETRLKLPRATREQLAALAKIHSRHNLDMVLNIRAQRSEHWVKLRPSADDLERERIAREGPEAAAQAEHEAMRKDLGTKFATFLDSLSPEERECVKVLDLDGTEPPTPPPGSEWVELQPGFPGGQMSQQLAEFAKDFPQVALPPGAFSMPLGGMPGSFGVPFQAFGPGLGAVPGEPFPAKPFPSPAKPLLGGFIPGPEQFGGPFAPGAEESFTLDDAASHQRKLEAANAYADTLGARLHADANERSRKLKLFKDMVAGGLHWVLEKVEGAPPPLPPEPVGPIEQGWARTAVNGGRPAVMQAIQEQLVGRTPNVVSPADLVAGESAFRVGAPGEEF